VNARTSTLVVNACVQRYIRPNEDSSTFSIDIQLHVQSNRLTQM